MGIRLTLLYDRDLNQHGYYEMVDGYGGDIEPAILFHSFDWTDWDGNTHHENAMNNKESSLESIEEYNYIMTHYQEHLKSLEPMLQDFIKQANCCLSDVDDFKCEAEEQWDENMNNCHDKYNTFEEFWDGEQDDIYNDQAQYIFDDGMDNLYENHNNLCDLITSFGREYRYTHRIRIKNQKTGEYETKELDYPNIWDESYGITKLEGFVGDLLDDTKKNLIEYYTLEMIDFTTLDNDELEEKIADLFEGKYDC
jgi:hypothetical protein